MAELILNVNESSGHEDGDVLVALNNRRIKACHAEHICHPQHEQRNSDGLRINGLSRNFLDTIYQYRFERVSEYEANRIETDYLGNVINVELIGASQWDLPEYLKRRKKHEKHRIFGTEGAEIWHGGRSDLSEDAINRVWTQIQTGSPHRYVNGNCPHCGQDHSLWAMGRLDVRHFLCIKVTNFSENEANALQERFEKTFLAGETITDIDGGTITPTWGVDNAWEHPTGKWLYRRDPETNDVTVTFSKRNMKAQNWRSDVLPIINKTEIQVLDRQEIVGREENLIDLSKAPWQIGNPTVYKVLDHKSISNVFLLRNKKENRPGKRLR